MRSPSAPWRRYLGCLPLALGLATKQPRRPPANTCTTGGPGGAFFLAPLLALPFLALAPDAAAEARLISNLGQPTLTSLIVTLGNADLAQSFTTGGDALTVRRVDVPFSRFGSPTAGGLTVKIVGASGSKPGTTVVGTLTNPTFSTVNNGAGTYAFTSSSGIMLAANTTYFVFLDSSSSALRVPLTTTSTATDASNLGAGTIGATSTKGRSVGAWVSLNRQLKIGIYGTINGVDHLSLGAPNPASVNEGTGDGATSVLDFTWTGSGNTSAAYVYIKAGGTASYQANDFDLSVLLDGAQRRSGLACCTKQGEFSVALKGKKSFKLYVKGLRDRISPEADETVELSLSRVFGVGVPSRLTINKDTRTITIKNSDPPPLPPPPTPVAQFAAATSSAAENAGTRNVQVNLNPPPASPITLDYTVSGTAVAGSGNDFTITGSGSVSVPANTTSVNIPVAILDDSDDENDETVILTLSDGNGYRVGSTNVHTLTITDNDGNTAPTVDNVITNQSATAGTAFSYAFPANTFNDADGDTLSYTATKGDGSALPTWLTFAPATRTFSGTPASGDVGTLTVKVTASDGNGGTVSDSFDIVVSAAGTPVAQFALSVSRAAENAGTRNVQVNLNPPPTSPITLVYTVGGTAVAGSGNDFTITGSGSVSVPANTASVNIPVAILDDGDDESDETVVLTLSGSGTGYTVGSTSVHTLTITDNDGGGDGGGGNGGGGGAGNSDGSTGNDAGGGDGGNTGDGVTAKPTVSISGGSTVTEGEAAVFNLSRSGAVTAALTVLLDVSENEAEGQDFVTPANQGNQQVVIPAGATTATYRVSTDDDAVDEPDGAVTVALRSSTAYDNGATATAVVRVSDNDTAGLLLSTSRLRMGKGGSASYTVALSSQPPAGDVVTVQISSQQGTGLTVDTDATMAGNQNTVTFDSLQLERSPEGDGHCAPAGSQRQAQ
ncbi:MAG: hypothetical protein F4X50_06185, partial [Synechococcus sp. SB0662_bin_14]|nr:hypothetical protein [Synechococcus sp. SB0662_bin_14]